MASVKSLNLDKNDPAFEEKVKPAGAQLKAVIQSIQTPATAYFNALSDLTMPQIKKAQRLEQAFQEVLDDPAAQEALKHPALKPLPRTGGRLTWVPVGGKIEPCQTISPDPGRSRVRPETSLISMRSPALSARATLCSCWTCCQTPPQTRIFQMRSSTASGCGRSPVRASGQPQPSPSPARTKK